MKRFSWSRREFIGASAVAGAGLAAATRARAAERKLDLQGGELGGVEPTGNGIPAGSSPADAMAGRSTMGTAAPDIRPFRIQVAESKLAELRDRLGRTRWPDQVGADWVQGTPRAYLQDLVAYWRTGYDWRRWERRLNDFPQFLARYDDFDLHFIHQRSRHPAAVPLMIIHGWPGSVFDFHKIIEPLADPDRFGGSASDAFHIICPSIPGFGFSSAPRRPGFDVQAAAELFARLMADLGYGRYAVQGGDLGAGIALRLGRVDPAHLAGIHLNLPLGFPPKDDPLRGVTPAEMQRYERVKESMKDGWGYSQIQGTKPQTLGYGLTDSPTGLAAWIVEKFHAWSQHSGNFETVISRDEVLTDISIYWFTGTITSSARYYYEMDHADDAKRTSARMEVPLSVALFPGEIHQPPRAWLDRRFNVIRWTEMARGGHFAALEAPDLLVDDIRQAFRPLR
jgi:pimeloyl-ACP methyl ester carboxylesterase